MTTPIQVAIEALPRFNHTSFDMQPAKDGFFFRADHILAALQAAQPVQSIDTAEFRALAHGCRNRHNLVEYIDAHIAQRAPVADAVIVLLNHIEDVIDDTNFDKIDHVLWNAVTMQSATGPYAPAPIADEVAGDLQRHISNLSGLEILLEPSDVESIKYVSAAATAKSTSRDCFDCAEALNFPCDTCPKASAPDAPAGELPPLPPATEKLLLVHAAGRNLECRNTLAPAPSLTAPLVPLLRQNNPCITN